jgi:hypothetical protein
MNYYSPHSKDEIKLVQLAKFHMIPYFEEVGIGDTCFYVEQDVFPEYN